MNKQELEKYFDIKNKQEPYLEKIVRRIVKEYCDEKKILNMKELVEDFYFENSIYGYVKFCEKLNTINSYFIKNNFNDDFSELKISCFKIIQNKIEIYKNSKIDNNIKTY
ncbi:MAG: hypothetical protein ACI4T1_04370 [Christensenellales bacterium]